MAERFEKTYISINEFINSWDKDVYELNNLDYFTYLLINELGNQIEHEFFNRLNKLSYLKIDPEEIGTLSFNIGDSFESFLENNCFGDCSMSCPTMLNEKVSPEEANLNDHQYHLLHLMEGADWNKKQYLLTDILNYVVIDTLFDFYNYEIGLNLVDTDVGLLQFADFISAIMEKFIETKGQVFLQSPKESAADLFDNLLQDTEDNWDESFDAFDDDDENYESWKAGNIRIDLLIEDYLLEQKEHENDTTEKKLLHFLYDYIENYAGIEELDEINEEDLREFFSFFLLREVVLENEISAEDIKSVFTRFFTWLDLRLDNNIKNLFQKTFHSDFAGIKKAMEAQRIYFVKNSLIDGILETNASEEEVVCGMFEIVKISANGFVRLRDIHVKNDFVNVQINQPEIFDRLQNYLIDATLKPTSYGWRAINLEFIFPPQAKAYLF